VEVVHSNESLMEDGSGKFGEFICRKVQNVITNQVICVKTTKMWRHVPPGQQQTRILYWTESEGMVDTLIPAIKSTSITQRYRSLAFAAPVVWNSVSPVLHNSSLTVCQLRDCFKLFYWDAEMHKVCDSRTCNVLSQPKRCCLG
jgi:hypothetical protein